ncbi:MetQ/NlpA family ABC transporter substrate-binding protein [Pseudomonas oryzihabitans]|uniref:MetQ/NlpA family ABC transporter substrate-binding protein n=1 Tax=Pseudomonas oryzihabitans TaxID=47885 RepID=UPI00111C97E0|nr:MetQ/NlpA family ABC transporter substrate-binding protein [Pseudomonas psychrotolerans]QDD87942.1 methionine ABC transporter substrate-binding protein [Pseudomonas psychrotolerans]
MTIPSFLQRLGLFLASSILALSAQAADLQKIRLGVTESPQSAALELAAKLAREKGVDVEIVSFSDWNTPNLALAHGDIDVNYFQHQPFLENANAQNGYGLVPIAYGVENKVGLYSKRVKSFAEVPDGATVAVADDPVNQGRGLQLYARAGLIQLKADAGPKASLQDIVANPKHLKFIELPGPQLARVLDDVTLAQSYPSYILSAGTADPGSALLFSDDEANGHLYALRFVTRPEKANDPAIRTFIQVFQSDPRVREAIAKAYGNPKLYSLAWLNRQEAAR